MVRSQKKQAAPADASHMTHTLNRLKAGEALKPGTIAAIQRALEAAGIEFIPENGGGAGVRLRKAVGGAGE